MNYVLKIPKSFATDIPIATISETLAQVAARGGDGTEPLHRPTLKNTRKTSLNRLQGEFDRGRLLASDGENNAATSGDVRFLFVQPPDLHAWATRNGDTFRIQLIEADHHIETSELHATVWAPDYGAPVPAALPKPKNKWGTHEVARLLAESRDLGWTAAKASAQYGVSRQFIEKKIADAAPRKQTAITAFANPLGARKK